MDHRAFYRKGFKPKDAGGVQGGAWWEMKPEDAAKTISNNIAYWEQNQRWRVSQLIRYARQYGNMTNLGFPGLSLSQMNAMRGAFGDQLTFNLTGSVIDTLVSKMARNKPKPYFLSNGGDYKAQRLAKDRNRFIEGVFYEQDTYRKTREAFRDACVWGPGVIKVYGMEGRVVHERVLPAELFVDEVEAQTGDPRQLHQIKLVDRTVLKQLFPDKAKEIDDSSWKPGSAFTISQHLADLVCVRESWHLPSSREADDGKRIITMDGCALTEMMDWKHDRFPFAIMQYCPRPIGFWPQGLAEQLQNIQLEVNKICWFIQRSIELAGTFKWWAPTGGGIAIEQLSNQLGAIIRSEARPEIILPQIVQPELYAHLQTQIQRGYQQAGISQMDAASTKPQGLDSGAAIREFHDIGTERYLSVGQAYEEFHCDIARLSIIAAQDLVQEETDAREEAKQKGEEVDPAKIIVTVPHRGSIEEVDFERLKFEQGEQFYLQCFPISALPFDPAGRLQQVQEYAQAGFIDPDTARDLLDFPDTGRVEGLHNAQRDFITRTLDAMIDDGETYEVEAAFDNVPLFQQLAMEYYQRGKVQGLPEGRLQLLRNTIQQCVTILKPPAPPMPPPGLPGPAGAGLAAPGVPTPPPVSDLLPNMNAPPMAA
jgi:hypothetical protein